MFEESNGLILVMEYIKGYTLSQLIDQKKGSQLLRIKIMRQLLDAAIILNRLGIVHRDFKPDNVIIKDEAVYVIDFGLSGDVGYDKDMEDYLFGTVGYVAPEVFQDEAYCTENLDVFSLGCIFYEIATRE